MQPVTTLTTFLALVFLTSAPAGAQWTNTSPLSQARGRMASAVVGDLAFFAGGEDPSAVSALNFDVVDVYDAGSDTWLSPMALSIARSRIAGTAVGSLVLFAGGGFDPATSSAVVDIFDTQTMSWKTPAALLLPRSGLAATTVGSKAIFGGGSPDFMTVSDVVDIYDDQAGQWTGTILSQARAGLVATTVGDLAMFAGGVDSMGAVVDTVDVYDDSTGTWSVEHLSLARTFLGAATVGTRAYFFGGGDTSVFPPMVSDRIDIYDASIGPPNNPAAWSQAALPDARYSLQATVLGNTLILAGGGNAVGFITPVVHMLDTGTGQWDSSRQLSLGAYGLGVASLAGKALYAGGLWEPVGNSQATARVDVHEPVGLNYCIAEPNSTGCAATISAGGSASLSANDLVLSSTCVPDGIFIYFYGAAQQQVPFGNGALCVGGTIKRILPAGVASGGLAQTNVDLPSADITTVGQRNLQCWFRDPAAGGAQFDTSDALAITFVP